MDNLDLLKILIIEDDACQVAILKQIVQTSCPNVVVTRVAKCMKRASKILKEGNFDIIFLDVNLGNDCAFCLLIPKTVSSEIAA